MRFGLARKLPVNRVANAMCDCHLRYFQLKERLQEPNQHKHQCEQSNLELPKIFCLLMLFLNK